ncbi:MAG: phage tail tube protein [Pseudomonadota bacterium]
MAKLTKGTQLYFIDPDDDSVVAVKSLTNFNPGGAPADPIDVTDLEDLIFREYVKGLRNPGQAAGVIQADPTEASHIRLAELGEESGEANTKWALGWSDGTAPPTVDTNGDFVLPATRTWLTFAGYVADFPFDFQINAVVATNFAIQRSGGMAWTKKV